jgi:hypothetical protein
MEVGAEVTELLREGCLLLLPLLLLPPDDG